nr:hypothetical protein Iba_chr15bCG0170 [Ipomoea batatas]GMD99968.1 hypothetical protein Iba_chr15fCG0880 [Ipomoea batatas]
MIKKTKVEMRLQRFLFKNFCMKNSKSRDQKNEHGQP